MKFDVEYLARIAGIKPNDNHQSIIEGLKELGTEAGLHRPHRLAHYLAQWGVESLYGIYDREIWGPTAAQKRYDIRTDLGNTPQRDGDGYTYRGRTGIQLTGRANYRKFTDWARKTMPDRKVPDFVAEPDKVNTDPWEGLVPIWYWMTGSTNGGSINRHADANNAEMVRRSVNGGLNGYSDSLAAYTRAALVLLGYEPRDIRGFQKDAKLKHVDGIAGPATREALHTALLQRPDLTFGEEEQDSHQGTINDTIPPALLKIIIEVVENYLSERKDKENE